MEELIALDGLSKRFGHLLAVDRVSFRVAKGQVLGFLGPNGAGKSTTMKMITGFLEPSSGTAKVAGFDIRHAPVEVKKRIGYLPEGAPTYGDMTPSSFLDFIAEVRGFAGREKSRRVDEVVERVRISEVLTQSIDTLSKGYKRRVGLAQAMLHDPEVLILDEPTDGLDPNQKHHVRGLIQEMAAEKAIIVSTHILEEVEAVCSRAIIIARGRIVADGTPEELLSRDVNHNAVIVRAAETDIETVAGALSEFGAVEKAGEGLLRIISDGGADTITRVGAGIREKNLNVEEVYAARGALDQVFRQITAAGETDHA